MNYCSNCGQPVSIKVPAGDNRPRYVCAACDTIHYQNPLLVVGAVPVWEDRILLCRRAIEPRLGYWTLPAGFMENDETLQEGAARETREEALADIEVGALFAAINVVHVNQVHVMFLARMRSPAFGPGEESLECQLLTEDQIPWQEIAFPSVRYTLERFFDDRRKGDFSLHCTDIRGRVPG